MTIVNGENFTQAQFAGRGYLTRLFDLSDALVAVAGDADVAKELAEDWATNAYNATVEGGEYSAKHYSTQASYWANRAEDSTVPGGGGEYSAKHYAAKAADSAAAASDSEDAAALSETSAASSAATAIAAAAAAADGVPMATTTGTGSAYTANFNPDLPSTDLIVASLNIHTTATSTTPTLAVDGGTPYPLVIGYDRLPIPTDLLIAGVNIGVQFDGTNNEWRIIWGLPLYQLNRTLNANGNKITNRRAVYEGGIIIGGIVPTLTDHHLFKATKPGRLYGIQHGGSAGTGDFTIKKNGTAIGFDDPNTTTLSASSTLAAVIANETTTGYVDYTTGDSFSISTSNLSGLKDLQIAFDAKETV